MILYILSGGVILFVAAVAYAIYLDAHSAPLQVCHIKPPRIIKTNNMEEIESSETLKKKIALALKAEELEDKIKTAKCPVCGSTISFRVYPANGYDGIGHATAHCNGCGMFSKTIQWDSQKSYNWKHDGSSSLEIMQELYNSIKNYIK